MSQSQTPHNITGRWRPREGEWHLKLTQQISGPGGIGPLIEQVLELTGKGAWVLKVSGHYFWNGIQVEGNVLGALEREFIEVNPGLLHCKQILYHLSHRGIPSSLKLTPNPSSIPKFILQGIPFGVWVVLGSCASSCCQQGAIVGLAGSPFSGEKQGERTWVESTEGAWARPCPAQLLLQIHRCRTLILVWTQCLTARNTGFSSNTYSFVETLENTKNKTLYNLLLVITIVNGVYHSSCLYVFIEIDSWFITVKNEYFVNMVTFFLILFFGCTTQHVGP